MTIGENVPHRDRVQSTKWYRELLRAKRVLDEVRGRYQSMWKAAKSEGENIDALKRAFKMRDLLTDEAVTETRDTIYYLGVGGMVIEPDTLFAGLDTDDLAQPRHADADQQRWDAEVAGYKAGRHGVRIDECPHLQGTELHVIWCEHWRKGQESIAGELGPNRKKADASRTEPDEDQLQMPGTERVHLAPEAERAMRKAEASGRKPVRKKARKKARRKTANGGAPRHDSGQGAADSLY